MPVDRRRPLSLALRITLFVGIAMTVLFVGFAFAFECSIRKHFIEQDLGELRAVAESLNAALAGAKPTGAVESQKQRLGGVVAGHHGVYFGVRTPAAPDWAGTAPPELLRAARDAPTFSALNERFLSTWSADNGHAYRGALLQRGNGQALVAIAIDFHLDFLARLRQWLGWSTLAVCLVALAAAWVAVRWGHAPMRRLSGAIGDIGSDQLHRRLDPVDVPYELEHLVDSFNRMLDRLQQSFERLSDFSADIAHELRTPVTNLTTQTQVALAKKDRTADAYREVLYGGLEELERLGKMIGDMLFLARAEHTAAALQMDEVDLGNEVRLLFDYFEALAEERDVRLTLAGVAPVVCGDRSMLRRALGNLISNGLRHVPTSGQLTVRLGSTDDGVQIAVENPGPDIAAEHLARLFDRFYRADPARSRSGEGAGLGLAIVRSIVEAHGGAVSARSNDGSTCFTIRLPGVAGSGGVSTQIQAGRARPPMRAA